MNKVKIITDSTIDLSEELYKKYDIDVIPLHITFPKENISKLDNIDIDCENLYLSVEKYNELPKTSACSVGELIKKFEKYINEGYDILFTGIGSGLSSNYQNAKIAAQEFDEGRVYIVDTKSLSTGSALVTLKMCKYRDQGLSAQQIYEKTKDLGDKLSVKFCIDRLDYLFKGGRCSGMEMIFANVLHIHPIAKVIDGKLTVYKKPRGLYLKAVEEQINEFMSDLENMDLEHVFITHSGRMNGEEQYIYDKLKKFVPEENLHITRAGCTISSHCGPKTIGILYLFK